MGSDMTYVKERGLNLICYSQIYLPLVELRNMSRIDQISSRELKYVSFCQTDKKTRLILMRHVIVSVLSVWLKS